MPILLVLVAVGLLATAAYTARTAPTVARDPAPPRVLLVGDGPEWATCTVLVTEYAHGRIVGLVVEAARPAEPARELAPDPAPANGPAMSEVA